jgi:hypothetical protein
VVSIALEAAVEAAVQAERARIYSELSNLAWEQDEYWRESPERGHQQRAFALGAFAGLQRAARVIDTEVRPGGAGTRPGLLPSYWQTECDKLGV